MITIDTGYEEGKWGQWVFYPWMFNYYQSLIKKTCPKEINFDKFKTILLEDNVHVIGGMRQVYFECEEDYLMFMLKWA